MAFKLSARFLGEYDGKQPEWGFGALSYFVYKRTYARQMADGRNEEYSDTCKRVTEGVFEAQRKHCESNRLPWKAHKAQKTAQEFFTRMWEFKFTPPGRGFWIMGTELVDKVGSAALNNCGFTSTTDVSVEFGNSFAWAMDMLMLGVGVGFDTVGAGKVAIRAPRKDEVLFVIPDSREGWVESVRILINSYQKGGNVVVFDYSKIRPRGKPIKGFGGTASGPDPLRDLHESIRVILEGLDGELLTSVCIVDLMNFIGKCVVAGNVRRSAELAIGDINDVDYIEMKDYRKFKAELSDRRWASNNSVFATPLSDFSRVSPNIALNGEPGLIFLENARHYGRVKDGWLSFEDERYDDVQGFNPCAEQQLEDKELCCLVETYPANHDSVEDYMRTLKFAYLYAKTITLIPTHDERTNSVMMRNRRIGCSMSGIQQAVKKFGLARFLNEFCDEGYQTIRRWDRIYSRWLGVPRSIRMSTVKPSGCQKKETMLITDAGILSFDELGDTLGEEWQDLNTNICQEKENEELATKFYVNGRQKTKKVLTDGGIELESTHNHMYRILTTGGEYIWKRADQVEEGDMMPYLIGGYYGGEIQSLSSVDRPYHNVKPINQPTKLGENLAWLIGLYVGDGSNHKKGIRIAGDINKIEHLEKAKRIIKEVFDIDGKIYNRTKSPNNADFYANSTHLVSWLAGNGLLKSKSHEVSIPEIIRRSPRNVIMSFIDGYACADGSIKTHGRSYCTTSKVMADQLVVTLRALGIDCKMRLMPPTETSLGNRMRYWINERKGRSAEKRYVSNERISNWQNLDKLGFDSMSYDTVVEIKNGETETFDIEVPHRNTYVANSYVSHNTVSILAGATPGVHYTHSEFYLRTVRVPADSPLCLSLLFAGYRLEVSANENKKVASIDFEKQEDNIYQLTTAHELSECAKLGATLVAYFPVKEKDFTKSKFDTTIWEQLAMVREMQYYWSDNSVSCTVTVKEDEKEQLNSAIEFYSPYVKTLSFLPLTDHNYKQAPYAECSKEDYEDYSSSLGTLALNEIRNVKVEGSKFCTNDTCEV